MQVEDALRNLGLDAKEAVIYRVLLELGQTTAYHIAEKSGLKRPTVYVVLDDLRMKGLVLKIPHAKKQLFIAKPPDELFREAEEKVRQARTVLPQLLATLSGAKKPKTLYFEGLDGMREVFSYGIEKYPQKEMIAFYAHTGDAPAELSDIFLEYNDKLRKHGIKTRGIAPQHETMKEVRRTDAEYGRNIREVPFDIYSANVSIEMGNEFTRLTDFKNLQAVVIENSDIARTLKQIFEMVWRATPEKMQATKNGTQTAD